MENKKFLRYCPNCIHYKKFSGVCSYINENIRDNPEAFIKYCNGEYFSLIKGKKIRPESKIADDEEIIPEMVTVYSGNNLTVFQIAKTLLSDHKIQFWSNGALGGLAGLTGFTYVLVIKVFRKDEKAARKLLSKLSTSNPVFPSNEGGSKINSFLGRWSVVIIILLLLLMFGVLYVLKNM